MVRNKNLKILFHKMKRNDKNTPHILKLFKGTLLTFNHFSLKTVFIWCIIKSDMTHLGKRYLSMKSLYWGMTSDLCLQKAEKEQVITVWHFENI